MSTYLLEVGTEELPYKFIPQAIEQLNNGFKKFFEDNKIKYEDIKVYATPRRLAVLVYGLEVRLRILLLMKTAILQKQEKVLQRKIILNLLIYT